MRLLGGGRGPHLGAWRYSESVLDDEADKQCRKYAGLAENRSVDCGPSNVNDNNINDSESPRLDKINDS